MASPAAPRSHVATSTERLSGRRMLRDPSGSGALSPGPLSTRLLCTDRSVRKDCSWMRVRTGTSQGRGIRCWGTAVLRTLRPAGCRGARRSGAWPRAGTRASASQAPRGRKTSAGCSWFPRWDRVQGSRCQSALRACAAVAAAERAPDSRPVRAAIVSRAGCVGARRDYVRRSQRNTESRDAQQHPTAQARECQRDGKYPRSESLRIHGCLMKWGKTKGPAIAQ